MTQAISQAKKMKDTEQLHLSVTSTNEPAKKLCAQLGFTYRKKSAEIRSNGLISFVNLENNGSKFFFLSRSFQTTGMLITA
ncbi:hypothetical protein QRX25_19690 [Bacillus sp. L381]|uniref:hypothetical protein n=1 Tax=Bacillus TaxID=1386 RepID=UPI002012B8AB|nr:MULTISPECIES: hypothetical protein [Bacillus]MCR9040161.1 hypothetical protein [Bacillus velezensis]WIX21773.1 hypothetical protein QRX25_19690 [Bacillus sp. L381]